jgi:membrane-associated protein
MHLFDSMMTLSEMIAAVGYLGVFVIVYLESGVPIGAVLPLPGDTLLFSAGLLASAGAFELFPLMSVIIVAAILGDSTGYWFGKKYGPRIFTKETGFFLNKKHMERAELFYKKFGRMAIIIARFLPLVRTLAPIFAGVGSMHYRTFLVFNIAGAFIWGVSITALGFFLGTMIPNVDTYLLPILLVIIVVTALPAAREMWKMRSA